MPESFVAVYNATRLFPPSGSAPARAKPHEEGHLTDPSQRMNKLRAMLEKQPDDAELLYCLAMEYKKVDDPAKAVECLDRVLRVDPGYCYAYYQKGHALEELGDADAAANVYREGIAAARRVGDAKAEGELSQALTIVE